MDEIQIELAKSIIEKVDVQNDILEILENKIDYYHRENNLYVRNILVKTKDEIEARIDADYDIKKKGWLMMEGL